MPFSSKLKKMSRLFHAPTSRKPQTLCSQGKGCWGGPRSDPLQYLSPCERGEATRVLQGRWGNGKALFEIPLPLTEE